MLRPSAAMACHAVGLCADARLGGLTGSGNTIVLAAGEGLRIVAVLALARAPVIHGLDRRLGRLAGRVSCSVCCLHIPAIVVIAQLFPRAGFAASASGVLRPQSSWRP